MFDTTQNITEKDQLSLVLRYNKIQRKENGKEFTFEIKETSLAFHEVSDHTAKGMTNEVLQIFFVNSIAIKKFLGKGYDGASVMSRIYNKV